MTRRLLLLLALACAIWQIPSLAQAQVDEVLIVDLTVANEVTISATDGLSAATVSGSDTTGFYLDALYNSGTSISDTLVSGNLTSANEPSDLDPNLFRGFGDPGLNVFSYTAEPSSTFTAGSLAFSGAGTWTITADNYADLLAGNASGGVYFPADTDDDVSSASLIGTYSVVVPEPGTFSLIGLGLGMFLLRKRR